MAENILSKGFALEKDKPGSVAKIKVVVRFLGYVDFDSQIIAMLCNDCWISTGNLFRS